MEYGQVVTLLFVALLGYYVFLIVTDLQKAKAAQMAEQENHMEEDIDISDEAQSFQPKKVGREEEKKEEQPTYYSGAVEVAKGDNVLFPTGLKFKVTQGKIEYITGNLINDISAYLIFCNNTFKSFDDLSKFFDKMHIEIKEGEE